MAVTRWQTRIREDDDATALVEFAVALPWLLVVAFGVVDFGRAFYVSNALNSIARDGARYGAALAGSPLDTAAIRTRVQTVIAPQYLNRWTGGRQLTATQIRVTASPTTSNGAVTVAITGYTFDAWLPVIPQARGLAIGASATFRREW